MLSALVYHVTLTMSNFIILRPLSFRKKGYKIHILNRYIISINDRKYIPKYQLVLKPMAAVLLQMGSANVANTEWRETPYVRLVMKGRPL